ncbi:MAG: NADH-quinone oxidoreductase subunit J [Steroidobacteraceae bacterium]
MSFTEILFYVFSIVLVASAIGVITARNPVHAALFLVFAFFNSAVIWMLLQAEFLAIILVLVYVGAVMVLFLFVVMMLDIKIEELRAGYAKYLPAGILFALIVIVEIASVVVVKSGDSTALGASGVSSPAVYAADYSNTKALGELLYTQYLYPLQLAATILLIAIVAAIVLTMRKRAGQKLQDINAQVAVNAKDRVRIVKVAAVKPESDAGVEVQP